MSSISIEELVSRKLRLEEQIKEKLEDFKNEVGFYPDEVNIVFGEHEEIFEKPKKYLIDVKVLLQF